MVFIFVQGPTCRQRGFVYVLGLVFIWGSRGGAWASCSFPSMAWVTWQSLQAPIASRWGDACSRLTPLLPPARPTCSLPSSLMKGTASGSLPPGLNSSEIKDACRVLFYDPELECITLKFTLDCISLLFPLHPTSLVQGTSKTCFVAAELASSARPSRTRWTSLRNGCRSEGLSRPEPPLAR